MNRTPRTGRRQRATLAAVVLALVSMLAGACSLGEESASARSKDGKDVLRVGYLHTVAVDSHLQYGLELGIFDKHDLEIETTRFDTGIAESQALSGGSIDVAGMGAVLSNFPAQGGGKVIGVNDIEYDTAQLWVNPRSGIKSVRDLEGKKVLTTVGTTAHVFLHTALVKNGVDPKSVTVTNAEMPSVAAAFASGKADAAVVWVPFDETVKKELPQAKLVDSAKSYYPEAAILGGWAANNRFHADEENKDVLKRFLVAWLEINDALVKDQQGAMTIVHDSAYADSQEEAATKRQFSFAKVQSNEDWAKQFEDGTVEEWIGQTEKVFVDIGGIDKFVEPSEFVDTELFLEAYDEWKKSR